MPFIKTAPNFFSRSCFFIAFFLFNVMLMIFGEGGIQLLQVNVDVFLNCGILPNDYYEQARN